MVYGRPGYVDSNVKSYRGVRLKVAWCVRHKYLETVTHTASSVLHALRSGYDVCLVCNAANAFLCSLPRLAGQRVVLNVDGIERLRKKWNRLGKSYYRLGEFLATQLPDVVVTDAEAVREYYLREYGFGSRFIPYGAPVGSVESSKALEVLGIHAGEYVLYVSRLEPENNAHLVIRAYLESGLSVPLVVVGDAPYSQAYIRQLRSLADGQNVHLPGAIYGLRYRELLSHCLCYVHATEVGGTHPALIEAMGAGCVVLVNDTTENREVVGDAGLIYPFNDLQSLARLMRRVGSESFVERQEFSERAQSRVKERYDWEAVTDQYEEIFRELTADTELAKP